MNHIVDQINRKALAEGMQPLSMHCVLQPGAIHKISGYLKELNVNQAVIFGDQFTFQIIGSMLLNQLQEVGISCQNALLSPNKQGDLLAVEETVVEAFLAVNEHTDVLIAVGAGTIHDVVRFVSYKMNIPFVSVPTAASVDGFTSRGAPLIIKQVKMTVQAVSPMAIFADLHILASAPQALTASGFADMLGKYTALADWQFSHRMVAEPFSSLAYSLTEEALQDCVRHVDAIAQGKEEGVKVLMQSLIISGLSMLLVNHSRSASGAEHHLSHMWEMDFIKQNRNQLLHGAKVGVATVIMLRLYRQLLKVDYREELNVYHALPDAEDVVKLIERVGGPTQLQQIGISETLFINSLREAHKLRDRYTGLKYMNQNGYLQSCLEAVNPMIK
jgi:glycerol-1-phosphate dehydrogenase [NAD(P)+]